MGDWLRPLAIKGIREAQVAIHGVDRAVERDGVVVEGGGTLARVGEAHDEARAGRAGHQRGAEQALEVQRDRGAPGRRHAAQPADEAPDPGDPAKLPAREDVCGP